MTNVNLSKMNLCDNNPDFDMDVYEEILVETLTSEELVQYARYGEMAVIQELVNMGLTGRLDSSVDGRGNTMLHMYAANGHLECMAFFLAHCQPPTINLPNGEGNTAIHWACVAGQLASVRLLLEAGAKVALENGKGRTPICEAQQHSRRAILEYFEATLGRKDEGMSVAVEEECEEEDAIDVESVDSMDQGKN